MKWLEESKARDVVALDVAGKSPCMDVVIVVTASSLRHAKSLADGLMEHCHQEQLRIPAHGRLSDRAVDSG
ncbi:MAG: RsfS/YbeB/iojap family protein [Bilophila wadsworthia]